MEAPICPAGGSPCQNLERTKTSLIRKGVIFSKEYRLGLVLKKGKFDNE